MMIELRDWVRCLTLVSVACLAPFSMAVGAESNKEAPFENRVLYYVNQYRAQHHLSPLKMQKPASREAYIHSRDMANKKMGFGHGGFGGRYKRLYKQGKNCRGAAENVAYYRMNPKVLVNGWIASPGHRKNILGNFNQTGIGVVESKKPGWGYMTQIFLRCE
jgi:uncharacterized protein YkwD